MQSGHTRKRLNHTASAKLKTIHILQTMKQFLSYLLILCTLSVHPLIANQSINQIRSELRDLRQQRGAIDRKIHEAQAKIRIIEKEDDLIDAINSLKVHTPHKKRTVLVYSRTQGFRHQSIPFGVHALTEMGKRTGAFNVVASEDHAVFNSPSFMNYDGVIMLNTTGNDVIPQGRARENFERFLMNGKGLIGIHAATDCHRNWSNYLEAMGGLFDGHPWGANHTVSLYNEEPNHPICNHIQTGDRIRDEIYQYREDSYFTRDKLRILLSLDLNGKNMKAKGMKRKDHDYAVSWIRKYGNSRVFYSNLGHNNETYHNPMALQHFLNGIQYALGDLSADDRSSASVGNGSARALPAGF